ncbi:MAG: hypothetical protein CL908_27090 [Deltaproteobacteria bacterium]|nr:hypothetical protein [Deltaproteobacteria bacterium]
MDSALLAIYLTTVLFASYWQSVTGFAMGMMLVAALSSLQLFSIPTVTAVVSLLSLANVCIALRGRTHHVRRRLVGQIAIGLVPTVFVGVWLLSLLDGQATWILELLLGAFITLGSLSMVLRPDSLAEPSATLPSVTAGVAAGAVGGMFSASGPVLGWFMYLQPMPHSQIRASLLACFALTTSTRSFVVGLAGGLTTDVLAAALIGFPVVALGTWLGREYSPPLPDPILKRIAFAGLVAIGLWISIRALR